FFSSRRRHTRFSRDWSSDVCSSDLGGTATGERWTWTADIFTDQQRLNEFGEQGWEVQGIDRLGRFVCTRDPEHPQRWEYRREVVTPTGRDALTQRLAPEGREPCGTWFCYAYYQR